MTALNKSTVVDVLTMTLLVLALLTVGIYAAPQIVGANQSYVVLSDSMEPSIRAGDVVIVDAVEPTKIDRGDVITYQQPGTDATTVTHRVVGVVEKDGEVLYRTKGDANEERDPYLVPAENVVGVVVFTLPLVGYVFAFADTTLGTIVLILVPAVLFVGNELWSLYVAARSHNTTGDS